MFQLVNHRFGATGAPTEDAGGQEERVLPLCIVEELAPLGTGCRVLLDLLWRQVT
jgi:hypothetical protein